MLWATGTAARLANRATLLSPDKANEFLAPAWTCTTGTLERDTSWRAEIPLPAGLSDTASWYRTQGWL
jgi:nucleoside-diphosphate-sugar epimerase